MAKVKLNILNMKNFLETVNTCSGKILLLCPNGQKADMNRKANIQRDLWQQYLQKKNHFPLVLEISDPGDYRKIVSYYAGDC